MITKALLDRFLKNECTEEERQEVLTFMEGHPDELKQLLPEDEFSIDVPPELTADKGEVIYSQLRKRLFYRRTIIRRLKYGLVAAASITLIFFVSRMLPEQHKELNNHGAIAESQMEAPGNWIAKQNHGSQLMAVRLPDSSLATLEPGATISFRSAFNQYPVREIRLQGKALFEVIKDKQHPFTVVSDEIATTALGTSFQVSAPLHSARILVHLFKGKVVIKAADTTTGKLRESYYLLPGDEFVYERGASVAKVTKSKGPKALDETTTAGMQPEKGTPPDWYQFGNQPLTQVIEQLSIYYNVKINYRKADLANRYFTGRFSVTDSIEVILNDIALIQDLKLTKSNGIYILRKRR